MDEEIPEESVDLPAVEEEPIEEPPKKKRNEEKIEEERSELRTWRNNLQRVRELSEITNLEHQIQGLLGHMTEHSRHGYLVAEQSKLQKVAADIKASLPDSMKSS